MRTRAERRKMDAHKAIRKAMIAHWFNFSDVPLHYYSKGKLHCSCPLCRAKTNRRTSMFGTCARLGNNWAIADIKKLDAMSYREHELLEVGSDFMF